MNLLINPEERNGDSLREKEHNSGGYQTGNPVELSREVNLLRRAGLSQTEIKKRIGIKYLNIKKICESGKNSNFVLE